MVESDRPNMTATMFAKIKCNLHFGKLRLKCRHIFVIIRHIDL
jgi:hypothetical protein